MKYLPTLVVVLFYSCASDSTELSSAIEQIDSIVRSDLSLQDKSQDELEPNNTDSVTDSIIGSWKGDWYRGNRLEIVRSSQSKYFRKNYYDDGTVISHPLKMVDSNGILSYVNLDEENLEYYRIEENGNLGCYSKWLKFKEIEKK